MAEPHDAPATPAPESHGWRAPAGRVAVASTLLVFTAFLFVAATVQRLDTAFAVWFSELFVFIGVPFVLVRLSGRDPVRYPGLQFPAVSAVLFGLAIGAANFFALAIPIQYGAQQLFSLLFGEAFVESFDSARIFEERGSVEIALILAGVTIAAPIGEEYFFRGVLQRSVHESRGPERGIFALVVAAVIFSAFHFDPVGFVARLELGLLFGWLAWRTGSIWPGVMAHAANNGITSALYFLNDPAAAEKAAEATSGQILLELALWGGLGLMAMSALLIALSKNPALLARVEPVERPLPPTPSFYRLAAPWVAGALLSLGLLLLVNGRGVRLNWFDVAYPIPSEAKVDPRVHDDLRRLRDRVRSGDAPMEDYQALRKELSAKYARPADKAAEKAPQIQPAPPPTPTP